VSPYFNKQYANVLCYTIKNTSNRSCRQLYTGKKVDLCYDMQTSITTTVPHSKFGLSQSGLSTCTNIGSIADVFLYRI
jgi:hypothetical protein